MVKILLVSLKKTEIVLLWYTWRREVSLQIAKVPSHFYPGDLVTRTGEREIYSISRRLPDYPGELA